MFRTMRRHAQQLSREESEQILRDMTCGTLAVQGDDGYPYTVPVNHVYREGKICFHCAREGHKIDALRRSDKVSFCVIAEDEVMAKERTTAFISVIAFGRARILEEEADLRRVAGWIGEKFSPEYPELCQQETDEVIAAGRMYCVEIEVEHLTGKCGREVMARRHQAAKAKK